MANKVFIGCSIDGYIADRDGGLDFLHSVPNPEQKDLGFNDFMETVDGLLMGRVTYEAVLGFGVEWPYSKPVFVLSSTLSEVPDELEGKVEFVSGPLAKVVSQLNERGFNDLYIDGGKVIQGMFKEDMVDELIVSTVPVLLGGGTPLFGTLEKHLEFELVETTVLLGAIVNTNYKRKR